MCNTNMSECDFQNYTKEALKELSLPITGEINDDKVLLIREGEVIGEIPYITNYFILDAFGNEIV